MKKSLGGIIAIILLVTMLFGCSSSDMVENVSYKEASAKEIVVEETKADMEMGSAEGVQIQSTNSLNRKIIKTGRLHIETKNFNETVQKIMDQTEEVGGFMQNCYIEGDQQAEHRSQRRAELMVRIPKEKFDAFMNYTDQYGNVVSKAIEGEDVTDQYFDKEMRFETLLTQRDRLNELLGQAGDLEDLFAIEQELAKVTYQIESLKGELNKYDSMIDYSTVNIEVYESYEYKERKTIPVTFGEKVQYQMKESFKWAIEVVEGLILIFITSIPFMAIIGAPVAIIICVIIKMIRRKKQ